MLKRLALLVAMLVLSLAALAPPVLAQEEIEGGSVIVDGDIVLDCRVFFKALKGFWNNPPSDRNSQRDFEEALGYVQLCTERGVVPPFDKPAAGGPRNGSVVSGRGDARPLLATGGFSPLFALNAGASVLAASLVVGGLLTRKNVR